ncbi:uncharacterized protein LOC133206002 [Saccostrea echinata]|uniref:uncharacterized protein LOC133206002 n=1 Tax=Saccostrea echinata TaxID=191078 RepID=UPI002A82264E|nr:uncharacterized protein LOC133206002 [Saccostrea echinata]
MFIGLLLTLLAPAVLGHGYLQEPPSRSSMWRFGFNTPHNYNDNQLFCGGKNRQWGKNGGKCGICGDPWDGVRENEAGGRYAKGIISRRYKEGEIIEAQVKITASHLGYFEFRLCPNNDIHKPATQACLDQYVLHQPNGSVRFMEQGRTQVYSIKLKLPRGLTCSQCVLQWKYNAGNSYGRSPYGGMCKGCGPQEQFYGCADIAIDKVPYGSQQKEIPRPFIQQHVEARPQLIPTFINGIAVTCRATPDFRIINNYADNWCKSNCRRGYCPSLYCTAACQKLKVQG